MTAEAAHHDLVVNPPERSPLRVLIDTLPIQPNTAGQRVYLLNLLDHLTRDRSVNCHLVCSRSNRADFERFDRVTRTILPWGTQTAVVRVLSQQVVLPLVVARHRPDVVFAPRDVGPILTRRPMVTAVLSGQLNLQFGVTRIGRLHDWYRRLFVPWSLRRSAKVVAISHYVATALRGTPGLDDDKITVIYLGGGLGETVTRVQDGGVEGDGKGIVLFVSSLFPHKNVAKLLCAYARLDAPPPLVIAGKDVSGERARLERLAVDLGIDQCVEFRGRVSDLELVELYRQAKVFVYPSAVEGFGIPLVEAMWFGVPVVASNRTSVPEVAGEAALVVDPDNVAALANAINLAINDGDVRAELIVAGQRRRTLFSWQRTAKETARVLRSAADTDRRRGAAPL